MDALRRTIAKIDSLLDSEVMFAQNFSEVFSLINKFITEIAEEWKKFVEKRSVITELSESLRKNHENTNISPTSKYFLVRAVPVVAVENHSSYYRSNLSTKSPGFDIPFAAYPEGFLLRLSSLNYLKKENVSDLRIISKSKDKFLFIANEDLINSLKIVYPGLDYSIYSVRPNVSGNTKLFLKGVPSSISPKNLLALDYFMASSHGLSYSLSIKFRRASLGIIGNAIKEFSELLAKLYKIEKVRLDRKFGAGNTDSYSLEYALSLISTLIHIMELTILRLSRGLSQGIWLVEVALSGENSAVHQISDLISGMWDPAEGNPISFTTSRWVNLWTTEELALFFGFPEEEKPGIRVYKEINYSTNPKPSRNSLPLGTIVFLGNPTKMMYELPVKALNKHAFVTGVTGSGKTTTIKYMLYKLWKLHGIPFLVIEPAKSEYREFIEEIEGGQYLDPVEDENFSMNFLLYPKGISWMSHADYLKSILLGNFNLPPFHSALLEAALYDLYERKYEKTLDSLIGIINEKINDLGLSGQTKFEVLASLRVRLGNLMRGYKRRIFSSNSSNFVFDKILTRPTVINLANIAADYEKSLIMSALLVYLYEVNQIKRHVKDKELELDHVTVIEEAHRILGKNIVSLTSMTQSEAQKGGSELMESFFTSLLAEIRAYGEGLVIVEQLPSKISGDVIKQTGTKIVHRLISFEDRKVVGDTMGLDEEKIEKLILLEPGEAIVFSMNTPSAVRVKVNLLRKEERA